MFQLLTLKFPVLLSVEFRGNISAKNMLLFTSGIPSKGRIDWLDLWSHSQYETTQAEMLLEKDAVIATSKH